MKALLSLVLLALVLPSCADNESGKPPVGPATDSNTKPWDPPKPPMGAFGALPEQPRR